MSMDTTLPTLPPNAAQETGGNLDKNTAAQMTMQELLTAILKELQIHNQLLTDGFGKTGVGLNDAAQYRADPTFP